MAGRPNATKTMGTIVDDYNNVRKYINTVIRPWMGAYVRSPSPSNIAVLCSDIAQHELLRISLIAHTRVMEDLEKMNPHKYTIADAANDTERRKAINRLDQYKQLMDNPFPGRNDAMRCIANLHRHFHQALTSVSFAPPWMPTKQIDNVRYTTCTYAAARERIKAALRTARSRTLSMFHEHISRLVDTGWNILGHDTADTLPIRIPAEFADQIDPINHLALRQRLNQVRSTRPVRIGYSRPALCAPLYKAIPHSTKPDVAHIHVIFVVLRDESSWSCQQNSDGTRELVPQFSTERYVLVDGFMVPHDLYTKQMTTIQEFMEIKNAEHRRVLMALYGYEKLIDKNHSRLVDMDVAPIHAEQGDIGITRALIDVLDPVTGNAVLRLMVATDGSTGRVYYMSATTANGVSATSCAEWDRLVGQPSKLYAQA